MVSISGFRYKWFSGAILWTDINENEDEYYVSMSKALVQHDPIDTKDKWTLVKLGKNVFIITIEKDAIMWKDEIVERFGEDIDFIPLVLKENEKAHAFCWRKDHLIYKPVDDLRSWSFNRLDKNFFALYPHVIKDYDTQKILERLGIILTE